MTGATRWAQVAGLVALPIVFASLPGATTRISSPSALRRAVLDLTLK